MLPKRDKPILVKDVRSDINVTPLVDVCLVLLIIFMVVTPMLQKGVAVTLPETNKPEAMPEGKNQLTMAVQVDGKIFIEQNWVPDENLKATLADLHTQNPDKNVVIKGDNRVQYRRVREVMQLLNEAGFGRVGLIAKRIQTS
jgi:biopolymer transport protein TolR